MDNYPTIYGTVEEYTDGRKVSVPWWCAGCTMDTGGNHEPHCPHYNRPDVGWEFLSDDTVRELAEAQAELDRGEGKAFDSVEALLADLNGES